MDSRDHDTNLSDLAKSTSIDGGDDYDVDEPYSHRRRPGLLSRIWRFLKAYFFFVGLASTALGLFLAILIASILTSLGDGGVRLGSGFGSGPDGDVILDLRLEGEVVQEGLTDERDRILDQVFGAKMGIRLSQLQDTLRKAAEDKNVRGLFVSVESVRGSAANISELRSILARFAKSGKPVHAWTPATTNTSLYLGSAAGVLTASPEGDVNLPGPAFELVFFGEALRKLGVGLDVLRAGKYKSAVEPLVSNAPSEASLEMYTSLEESLRRHSASTIAEGRKGDASKENVDEVLAWFQKSIFTPDQAMEHGFVDGLKYRDQAFDAMNGQVPVKVMDWDDYVRADTSTSYAKRFADTSEALALIQAKGEIAMEGEEFEDIITPKKLAKRLKWAIDEEDVKAVVLRIDSPGGSALASDLIWRDVERLASVKPVVVSMGSYAASGGYYIAAPATKILAQPTTLTGSIGVFGVVPNLAEFEKEYGISFHTVTGSDRKSMLQLGTPLDAHDRSLLEGEIGRVYQTFLGRVASGRSKEVEEIHAIAQGRVWTGIQAKEAGLVDGLGGLHEAFQEAKRLAGLDDTKLYEVRRYRPRGSSIFDCLSYGNGILPCLTDGNSELVAPLLRAISPHLALFDPQARRMRRLGKTLESLGRDPIQARWLGVLPE